MSEMQSAAPALPLWTTGIGLAAFIYGFGSGARRNDDFRMAFLIGLAGAVIFIVGIAALDPDAPSDV